MSSNAPIVAHPREARRSVRWGRACGIACALGVSACGTRSTLTFGEASPSAAGGSALDEGPDGASGGSSAHSGGSGAKAGSGGRSSKGSGGAPSGGAFEGGGAPSGGALESGGHGPSTGGEASCLDGNCPDEGDPCNGMESECSAHGFCSDEGDSCVCEPGWQGKDCSVFYAHLFAFNEIQTITIDGSRLWLGTTLGLLLLDHAGTPLDRSDDRMLPFTWEDGLEGADVGHVEWDPRGGMWIATQGPSGALNFFDPGEPFEKSDDQWVSCDPVLPASNATITDMALDEDGLLWATRDGFDSGVYSQNSTPLDISDDSWTPLSSYGSSMGLGVSIAVGPNARWLAGPLLLQAYRPSPHTLTTYSQATTGLPSERFDHILVQGNDRLWTTLRLEDFTDPDVEKSLVALLDHGDTLSDQSDDQWMTWDEDWTSIHDLALDPAGVVWVGSGALGLSRIETGADPFAGDVAVATRLVDEALNAVTPASANELWLGGPDGLWYLDHGGTAEPSDDQLVAYAPPPGISDKRIRDAGVDSAGKKWFTTRLGADFVDDRATPRDASDDIWVHFGKGDLPGSTNLSHLVLAPSGIKYFHSPDTSGATLTVLLDGGTAADKTDDTWLLYTLDDGAPHYLRDMVVDSREVLHAVAQAEGLRCLDDGGTPNDASDDEWRTLLDAVTFRDQVALAPAPGGLYIATPEDLLYYSDGGTSCSPEDDEWTRIRPGGTSLRSTVRLESTERGGLWLQREESHLISYHHPGYDAADSSDDQFVTFDLGQVLEANEAVERILPGPNESVWVAFSGGLLWLETKLSPFDPEDDEWHVERRTGPNTSWRVTAMAQDPLGGLWLGTAFRGVVYFELAHPN